MSEQQQQPAYDDLLDPMEKLHQLKKIAATHAHPSDSSAPNRYRALAQEALQTYARVVAHDRGIKFIDELLDSVEVDKEMDVDEKEVAAMLREEHKLRVARAGPNETEQELADLVRRVAKDVDEIARCDTKDA
ncbi:hypothetical protein HDV00_007590 [Rhizophlyctis rosea]|nr:hypothetical protein HDV00_007590 [Rhizophlyctis rosea]